MGHDAEVHLEMVRDCTVNVSHFSNVWSNFVVVVDQNNHGWLFWQSPKLLVISHRKNAKVAKLLWLLRKSVLFKIRTYLWYKIAIPNTIAQTLAFETAALLRPQRIKRHAFGTPCVTEDINLLERHLNILEASLIIIRDY